MIFSNRIPPRVIPLLLALCLCAGIAAMSGCKSRSLNAVWHTETLEIDGRSADWDNVPRTVFDNPKVSMAVCNDEKRLYLMFHVNDPDLVLALESRGATLWLTPGSSKKKNFGVTYRGIRTPDARNRPSFAGADDRPMPPDSSMVPSDWTPEGLTVLYGTGQNRIPVREKDAGVPAAGFQAEGGGATYEFSIPLASAEMKYGVDAEPGSVLSIGLQLGGEGPGMGGPGGRKGEKPGAGPGGRGGMPGGRTDGEGGPGGGMPPGGQGGGQGGPGGMGGGMGGGPRGGPGMGGRGPGADQMDSQKTEVWFKLKLAEHGVVVP